MIPRKFTNEEARAIRDRVANGESQRAVARSLGCSQASLSAIINGKTYANAGGLIKQPVRYEAS